VSDPVTVTEFQPPTRFAISHDGRFTGGGVLTLEPGADGTTTIVRWDETLIAPLLPHVAAVAMAPLFRSIFQRDLERLRDLVESGEA
jgi:Polyketide cyclase / dehydrase and lipid transport